MNLSPIERYQIELLKKKTPIERLYMQSSLINGQFKAMRAGIHFKNQNASDEELKECFCKRMMKIYSLREDWKRDNL